MKELIVGRVTSCFANHDPLEETDCPNFSGHIGVSTDKGYCDILTDDPESYRHYKEIVYAQRLTCARTPISIPVENSEGNLHLCPI